MINCCVTEKPLIHKFDSKTRLNFKHLTSGDLFDCCLTEQPLLYKPDLEINLYFNHLRSTTLFDCCLTDGVHLVPCRQTAELATTVQKIDQLRSEIDAIVAEINA